MYDVKAEGLAIIILVLLTAFYVLLIYWENKYK